MLVLMARAPRPDVPYWPGRRSLAVVDALAWPALLLLTLGTTPLSSGIFGVVASALTLLIAARRWHRAVFCNQRYRLTTSRWGMVLAALILGGAGARLMSMARSPSGRRSLGIRFSSKVLVRRREHLTIWPRSATSLAAEAVVLHGGRPRVTKP